MKGGKRSFYWRNGQWVEREKTTCSTARIRKAPSIRCDTIDATMSHATGRTYTSRSEMNRDIKASGAESVDWNWAPKTEDRSLAPGFDEDFEKAANDLRWGNAGELSEFDKHVCKEIDERLDEYANSK